MLPFRGHDKLTKRRDISYLVNKNECTQSVYWIASRDPCYGTFQMTIIN